MKKSVKELTAKSIKNLSSLKGGAGAERGEAERAQIRLEKRLN
jgi:hypothetical protein